MQLGGASDLVNVGPPPATDLVNVIEGPSDLVNVGPPPATNLVNTTWGVRGTYVVNRRPTYSMQLGRAGDLVKVSPSPPPPRVYKEQKEV